MSASSDGGLLIKLSDLVQDLLNWSHSFRAWTTQVKSIDQEQVRQELSQDDELWQDWTYILSANEELIQGLRQKEAHQIVQELGTLSKRAESFSLKTRLRGLAQTQWHQCAFHLTPLDTQYFFDQLKTVLVPPTQIQTLLHQTIRFKSGSADQPRKWPQMLTKMKLLCTPSPSWGGPGDLITTTGTMDLLQRLEDSAFQAARAASELGLTLKVLTDILDKMTRCLLSWVSELGWEVQEISPLCTTIDKLTPDLIKLWAQQVKLIDPSRLAKIPKVRTHQPVRVLKPVFVTNALECERDLLNRQQIQQRLELEQLRSADRDPSQRVSSLKLTLNLPLPSTSPSSSFPVTKDVPSRERKSWILEQPENNTPLSEKNSSVQESLEDDVPKTTGQRLFTCADLIAKRNNMRLTCAAKS